MTLLARGSVNSCVSVRVGGGQDTSRAELSKELFFVFVLPAGLDRAKFESRFTEGTDVVRRTSSTFSLQEVESESAILGVKRCQGNKVMHRADYRTTGL